MPLTKDELGPVAEHFITAASHYKRIGRMLEKARGLIELFDETGHALTPDQVTDLKADLLTEKALGDTAIAAAEAEISD